jgi:hypothetical protein
MRYQNIDTFVSKSNQLINNFQCLSERNQRVINVIVWTYSQHQDSGLQVLDPETQTITYQVPINEIAILLGISYRATRLTFKRVIESQSLLQDISFVHNNKEIKLPLVNKANYSKGKFSFEINPAVESLIKIDPVEGSNYTGFHLDKLLYGKNKGKAFYKFVEWCTMRVNLSKTYPQVVQKICLNTLRKQLGLISDKYNQDKYLTYFLKTLFKRIEESTDILINADWEATKKAKTSSRWTLHCDIKLINQKKQEITMDTKYLAGAVKEVEKDKILSNAKLLKHPRNPTSIKVRVKDPKVEVKRNNEFVDYHDLTDYGKSVAGAIEVISCSKAQIYYNTIQDLTNKYSFEDIEDLLCDIHTQAMKISDINPTDPELKKFNVGYLMRCLENKKVKENVQNYSKQHNNQ